MRAVDTGDSYPLSVCRSPRARELSAPWEKRDARKSIFSLCRRRQLFTARENYDADELLAVYTRVCQAGDFLKFILFSVLLYGED